MAEEKKITSSEEETTLQASAAPESGTEKGDKSPSPLESFLSREPSSAAAKSPSPNRHKTLFIILGAVAVIAVLIVVLIIVRSRPMPEQNESYPPAELTLDVNADGQHEAAVALDENGKLINDGSGNLLTYDTAQIKQIDVENEHGSFSVTSVTPEGEATVYTLVGFENYDLQSGVADEIATHSASISFDRVIAVDANLADFGLDKPRATVKIIYQDGTSSVLRIGSDAAGEAGTYLSFGSANTVYLTAAENIECYLYSINHLISQTITDTNEDSDNAEFSELTISGTRYDEPITLVPNKDEALEASYLMTAPAQVVANALEASDVAGNIRGLNAEEVVCVNPSADQLASYGLDQPYASVKASYPDTDITLHASAPGDDGLVYIYNPDKNVVYTIQLAAVSWAKTGVDLLMPENPLNVKLRCVDTLTFVKEGDMAYEIDVNTTSETVTGDDGTEQESYTTTATYNGKDLDTDNFTVFFQNLSAIKNLGAAQESSKDEVMSVTLHYTTDRADDTLTIYTSDATKYIMSFNGTVIGTASKSYIDSLIEGADALIKGETVTGL